MARHVPAAASLLCVLALSALVRGIESDFNHTDEHQPGDKPQAAGSEGDAGEGVESLLHWAISNSDPEALRREALAASGGDGVQKLNLTDLKELAARRAKVKEAIEAFAEEPTEAELIKEGIAVVENYLSNWADQAEAHGGRVSSDDHAAACYTVENALKGLQILCEPIDNANDFSTMGGLAPVVRLLSDVRRLRISAAAFIGTAASNNPTFQGHLLQQQPQAMSRLIAMLGSEHEGEATKGVIAVAAVVRNLGEAQDSFLSSGGVEAITQLTGRSVAEGQLKLASRSAQFATDLVVVNRAFLPHFMQGGMLGSLNELLKKSSSELDILEKSLFAIESLAAASASKQAFRDRGTVEALLAVEAALMAERENQSDDDTEFLDEIVEMTRSLAALLSPAGGQAAPSRDEL